MLDMAFVFVFVFVEAFIARNSVQTEDFFGGGGDGFLFVFFTLVRPRYVASTTFCNVTECCGGENYRGDNRWTDGRRQGVSRQRSNHAIRAEPGGRVPESEAGNVSRRMRPCVRRPVPQGTG